MRTLPWILIGALSFGGAWSVLYEYRMWMLPYPWNGIDYIGCSVASAMATGLMLMLVAATHIMRDFNRH